MSTSSHHGEPFIRPPRAEGETSELAHRGGQTALAKLADVIDAIGEEQFPARLATLIEHVTGYESAVFICYFKAGGAALLFSNLCPDDERRTLDPYFDGAYLLDPWYNMIREGTSDGVYRLSECAPDDFMRTEYYRTYYANMGLQDECALFLRLSETATIVLSIGTRQGRQPIPGGLDALAAMLPCIRAVSVRHWPKVAPDGRSAPDSLAELCVQFGLSEREIEVITLLLRGYSNKIIARNLSISPETVKVYRKRINKKLGTSSTRELFARFFRTARRNIDRWAS
jgi:DNA-binding CsgD family transcriptional regulator